MPIKECSPNGMGIYGKTIAFVAMVYAGAERFSHLIPKTAIAIGAPVV